jgi:hypothetical protein
LQPVVGEAHVPLRPAASHQTLPANQFRLVGTNRWQAKAKPAYHQKNQARKAGHLPSSVFVSHDPLPAKGTFPW